MPQTLQHALNGRPQPTAVEIFTHGTRLLKSAGPSDLRIVVAGSSTIDMVARAVAVATALEGRTSEIIISPFGAWQQEALDPMSSLRRGGADILVLVNDWRDLVTPMRLDATLDEVRTAVAAKVKSFRVVWDALVTTGVRVIQHLPAEPLARYAGIAERRLPASPLSQMRLAIDALLDAGPEIIFLDMAGLVVDPRAWYGAKLTFGQQALPEYVARMRGALRTATSRAKKVLALDLDNTLWGGVIGDDGVSGIKLGPETPTGSAFTAFQAYVKALAARGIILAVCSKNEPEIAETGLSHPHSLLQRSDFAAFECSWSDKAGGLRRIAQALNVGIDSIVFADDNPVECALVREMLPEVAVVELGGDPAVFIEKLDAGCWFDSQGLSREDFARGALYQARAEASAAQASSGDLGSFLASLDMKGVARPAQADELARVAQLEGKTNQFNLTTRRYDQAQVAAFAERDDAVVLVGYLADKFGDHGLVSTVIGVKDGDALSIESWLMSCRVFSRTFEHYVMREILVTAGRLGARRVVGRYERTSKNDVVADLYERLGFKRIGEDVWERAVDRDATDLETCITAR